MNMAAAHLFVKPVIYTVSRFFASTRPAGRPAGRPCGARVVRGEKKNAGGPGGGSPPAKPVKGGVWGGEAPPAKIRGVWGAAPPSQNRKNFDTVLPSLLN